MTDELTLCMTCGEAFDGVDLFEVHMLQQHGPRATRSLDDAPQIRVLDLPDDDDDDDDDEENGELFPHKPARVARLIEKYRDQAEHAIEEKCLVELAKHLELLELLESELLRRATSTCEQTLRVAALRRMVEFVLRDDRKVAR